MNTDDLRQSGLDEAQGAGEERTELYLDIQRGSPVACNAAIRQKPGGMPALSKAGRFYEPIPLGGTKLLVAGASAREDVVAKTSYGTNTSEDSDSAAGTCVR